MAPIRLRAAEAALRKASGCAWALSDRLLRLKRGLPRGLVADHSGQLGVPGTCKASRSSIGEETLLA